MLQTLFGRRSAGSSNVKQIRASELWDLMQNGDAPLLVDVRSSQEFQGDGHIAGARLLPLQMITQRGGELPKDRPIVCVCRSGSRSQVACEQLAAMGYTDLTNLAGGMMGWKSARLPWE
ncbi:MAG: rhodanese-like domain-containing protein [Caldilineaceae bacterium]|nr:rhodanese-like domain-containing protein [Caldilineaceae bacterium]